jgi:hypothetical protein
MKSHPTFEQLRETGELNVVHTDTGVHFRISLRDWANCLWAIRVHPRHSCSSDRDNSYVTVHRLMGREGIEEWLSQLKLAQCGED